MVGKRWLSAKDAMSSRMTSCRATSSDGRRCFVKPAPGNQRPRPYLGHNCPGLFSFCKMPPSRSEPVFRCTQAKPRGERRENPEEAPVLKSVMCMFPIAGRSSFHTNVFLLTCITDHEIRKLIVGCDGSLPIDGLGGRFFGFLLGRVDENSRRLK